MKKVVAIIGPTAVGKTKLSIDIALRYNNEIISGDSVQVYKGLDIGSAKITKEEMRGVKHHLIDILEPTETYDVSLFQKNARELINQVKYPMIVGGTGLYIKAALDNYDFSGEKRDFDSEDQYSQLSNEELYEILLKKDPNSSLKIHPNNRRRVLRAIALADNKKRSDRILKDEPIYNYKLFYLTLPRPILYDRINKRVDLMITEGFIDEVKALKERNIYLNILGYRELFLYLDGKSSLTEAIEEIKKKTRRFAKRQETWFKNQMNSLMIDMQNPDKAFSDVTTILDRFWEE
ncbi:MAG: tRNA (adenosine(37)-N6)-dimethylallyltransferase MiaA [Acholeplasmataceae bacterium]|nr:tRNA (adenosine(37)-N6)-dimethylallyltransferase MiaA [Acholeplasmataceae bacterium]